MTIGNTELNWKVKLTGMIIRARTPRYLPWFGYKLGNSGLISPRAYRSEALI